MHIVLTRILIAVATISMIAFIFSGYNYLAADIQGVRVVNIDGKLHEVGRALFTQDNVIVYGISTGSKPISVVDLGLSSITLSASGDDFVWSAPRSALAIKGLEIYCGPDNPVTLRKNDYIQLCNQGADLYASPKLILEYSTNASGLGGHTVHWVRATSCTINPFNTSGTFDLKITVNGSYCRAFERPCLFDTTIKVFFENEEILSAQAKKGDLFVFEGCIRIAEITYMKR